MAAAAKQAVKDGESDEDTEANEFFDVKQPAEEKELKKNTPHGLAQQNNVVDGPQIPVFVPHPHDMGRLIPEFSEGDGVSKWLRRIDHFRAIYGWSQQMCLLYGSTRLTGAAANWYRRQEEYIFNWTEFKEQLVVAFPETYDEADIHRQLESTRIEKGESYESFVYRVDALAQKGDFSTSATLKYIIRGLRHDKVYLSLLSRQYTSTLELLRHIKWIASNLDMVPAVSTVPRMSRMDAAVDSPGNALTCFNCREPGHKSIECPKPPRRERCSKCLKVGHAADKCTIPISTHSKETNQLGSRGAKWSTTNAVFGSGESDSITVNPSSQVEVDIDRIQDRIHTLALVDSGSYANLIRHKCLYGITPLKGTNENVIGINNTKVEVLGEFVTTVGVGSKMFKGRFLVVADDTMQVDVILGRDFLFDNCIRCITFSGQQSSGAVSSDWSMFGEIENVCVSAMAQHASLDVGDDESTRSHRMQLESLLTHSYFERQRPVVPLVSYKADIRLKENKIFTATPQRLSVFESKELDKIVEDLLEQGIIRESESPYTSRVVLTRKKNNSYRMCVNYKPLNKIAERNHFPMPIIEDQIMRLQGKRYFTSLDLKNGFYHVELEEHSKKYTSFVTSNGQYEFNRLPFGYSNSPAIFVKFITKVLAPFIKDGRLTVFIDDMLIASETIEQHFQTLKEVLETLVDNRLELQLSKCQFLKTRVEYLGYDVEFNRIQPSDRHIQSVRDFPVPTDRKSLQRFLGLVNYFRKFINGFNVQAGPLYELLKEDQEFKLTTNHVKAIESLKVALISKPVLRIYSPTAETELHTDASSSGYGGVLLQRQSDDGLMHPVMYHSRKTTPAESRLHSFELETLAIMYCLQRFRMYLFGLHFKVVTDCSSLKQTLQKKDVNAKIARWAMYLEQFDFEIIHRPGTTMQHADALSRINVYLLDEEDRCSPSLFENALYVSQLQDPDIAKIKQAVELGSLKDYEIRDAILYKVIGDNSLLYVPTHMIPSVINKFHNEMGHFGVDKVCGLIKRTYWFPKMREQVLDHCKRCITCIAYNPRNKRFDGNLNVVEKPNVPFDVIHVDHLGPLEKGKGKNEHIFAVVDSFTKFIKLYPTKTTKTCEFMRSLKSYFHAYSTPKVLISDRGTAFTSAAFDKFVQDHGIRHVKVATACPKANGQVERYNRTLLPLLSKLVEETGSSWDTVLTDAEFLLNNTSNRATGCSPSTLMFGVDQRRNIEADVTQYLLDLVNSNERNLPALREVADENVKRQQQYNKKVHDRHCTRNTSYKVGDLVMLRRVNVVGERSKLKPKFRGPYIIKRVLDRNRYVVGDIEGYQVSGKRFEGIFDPLNIRLYQERHSSEQVHNSEDESQDVSDYQDVEYLDEEFQDADQRDSDVEYENIEYLDETNEG